MIKLLKKMLQGKEEMSKDRLSSFFFQSSSEEKRRVFLRVLHQVNEEQRERVRKYEHVRGTAD